MTEMPDVGGAIEGATGNIKNQFARLTAWAKKNPALAAVAVGGTILVAFLLSRGKGYGGIVGAEEEEGLLDDPLEGIGGLGFGGIPVEPLGGELMFPPLEPEPLYPTTFEAAPTWVPDTVWEALDKSISPPVEEDYYRGLSEEFEALAGEYDQPVRGNLADIARWYGWASYYQDPTAKAFAPTARRKSSGLTSEQQYRQWAQEQNRLNMLGRSGDVWREATARERAKQLEASKRVASTVRAAGSVATSTARQLLEARKRLITGATTAGSMVGSALKQAASQQ